MPFSLLRRVLLVAMLAAGFAGALIAQERVRPLDKYVKPADKGDRSDRGKPDKKDTAIPLHIDHIFNGGINRRGDIVGVHHLPSAPKQMRVEGKMCDLEIKQTSPGGEKDVVTAKVILRDPASGKVVREKFSTLFPSAWTKADIEQAIRESYSYAKEHGGVDHNGEFHGRARGIKIDGYLTERGDAIATAFPVFQAPQKKTHSKGTHNRD